MVKAEQLAQSGVLRPELIHLGHEVVAVSGIFVHGAIFGAEECRMLHPWSSGDRSAVVRRRRYAAMDP